MSVSDDGPLASAYVSLDDRMKGKECSAHTAYDEMAQEINRQQEGGKRREKEKVDLTILQ
jgi:hypothetical protein